MKLIAHNIHIHERFTELKDSTRKRIIVILSTFQEKAANEHGLGAQTKVLCRVIFLAEREMREAFSMVARKTPTALSGGKGATGSKSDHT